MEKNLYELLYQLEDKYWWFRARRKIVASLIDKFLKPPGSLKILDIGCGTGREIKFLNKYGQVKGIDNAKEAIEFCCQSGYKNQVLSAEANNLPYKEESFDLVTVFDLLEHTEDDQVVIQKIKRVLKRGGHAVFTVPAYRFLWGKHDELSHHFRRYTTPSFKKKLTKESFRIVKLSYFNTFLFLPILLVRFVRKHFHPLEKITDFKMTPAFLNKFLEAVLTSEHHFLKRCNFPFGVSIICLVQKI